MIWVSFVSELQWDNTTCARGLGCQLISSLTPQERFSVSWTPWFCSMFPCSHHGQGYGKQWPSPSQAVSYHHDIHRSHVSLSQIWNKFWHGGCNPLRVIYLLQVETAGLKEGEIDFSAPGQDSTFSFGIGPCKLCSQTCCFHKTKVINWSYKYELHLSIKFSIKFISMFCPIPLWSIPLHLALAMQFKKIV